MNGSEYVVAIVLDEAFGERLRTLAERCDLWTVPSAPNRSVVEELWAEQRAGKCSHQVTIWSQAAPTTSVDDWLSLLDQIELHHGKYSHEPSVSTLEIFGVPATPEAQRALKEFGYECVEFAADGFKASRRIA